MELEPQHTSQRARLKAARVARRRGRLTRGHEGLGASDDSDSYDMPPEEDATARAARAAQVNAAEVGPELRAQRKFSKTQPKDLSGSFWTWGSTFLDPGPSRPFGAIGAREPFEHVTRLRKYN